MDQQVQKSCWGVATWTVVVLGGMLLLAFAIADIGTVASVTP